MLHVVHDFFFQGTESMTVLLGCPPSMKVVFDPEATVKASGKNQFCNEKNGIACFLFDLSKSSS